MANLGFDFQSLSDLLDHTDGAAYLVNVAVFQRNALDLLSALRSEYANSSLGYSYKTNYLPALCREADRIGMYAEVVSGLEYQIARYLGIPGERIIYNGPVKSVAEIEEALESGSVVNIDSLDEVTTVERVLRARPEIRGRLGLRCSLEMPWPDRSTRFGLSHRNGDLFQAAERIGNLPNATLAGLHSHTSSDREISSFVARATTMVSLAKEIFGSEAPGYINMGGGMCGPLPESLRRQLQAETYSFPDFAREVAAIFASEYGENGATELLFEPGVALVGDCMHYVCRVESVKHAADIGFVTVSGSVNHIKILPNTVNQPLTVFPCPKSSRQDCDSRTEIVGFTCLEHDVLYHDFRGSIAPGDILLFSNVGAYSFVTAADFIRTVPPIYAHRGNGEWTVMKRRLGAKELLSHFVW